jgi:hypothetical protein
VQGAKLKMIFTAKENRLPIFTLGRGPQVTAEEVVSGLEHE